jgi:membrane protein DedA with SNARE-associated domain
MVLATISDFILHHASYAHWLILFLLMAGGLNIPISEDLVIITAGIIASSVIPEHTLSIMICMYVGCYLGDMILYSSGRFLGPKLSEIRFTRNLFSPKRMESVQRFYQKWGLLSLILGRLIPFGVRNALFISAGYGKMPFVKFLITDSVACLLSNTTIFSLAYFMGKNLDTLSSFMKGVNLVIFFSFLVTLIGIIWYTKKRKMKNENSL